MFHLLDPRLWLAFLLACAISGGIGFLKGNNHGKTLERAKTSEAVAAANNEARKMEERRQSAVDKAGASATARQTRIAADSAGAGGALQRLRDAISAQRSAEESVSAANKRAESYAKLLIESGTALTEMARSCDRILSDRQMLLDAWPR